MESIECSHGNPLGFVSFLNSANISKSEDFWSFVIIFSLELASDSSCLLLSFKEDLPFFTAVFLHNNMKPFTLLFKSSSSICQKKLFPFPSTKGVEVFAPTKPRWQRIMPVASSKLALEIFGKLLRAREAKTFCCSLLDSFYFIIFFSICRRRLSYELSSCWPWIAFYRLLILFNIKLDH